MSRTPSVCSKTWENPFIAAGILTCGFYGWALPSRYPSGLAALNLAAHSCGGSHGFGPDWVVRTVFPVRLLAAWLRSTTMIEDVPCLHRIVKEQPQSNLRSGRRVASGQQNHKPPKKITIAAPNAESTAM